jgi:hypothetical protein
MELRYLRQLIPLHDVFGCKTQKYGNVNRGLLLQFKKDGEWENIKEVTEVLNG